MPRLTVFGEMKQKHGPEFDRLCALVEERAKVASIYTGCFLKMEEDGDGDMLDPSFLPVPSIEVEELLLNEPVRQALEGTLFNPLSHTEVFRKEDPTVLSRKVLLHGDYGCGKTLAMGAATKLGTENGWTFIQVSQAKDLAKALAFATAYQPCMVLMEDIDMTLGRNRDGAVNTLINTMDGVLSKGAEVMLCCTTNHIEKIQPVSLRPGRIETVGMERPDETTIVRLLQFYGRDHMVADVNLAAVAQPLLGMIPSAVAATVQRARSAALPRGERLTTELLVAMALQVVQQMQYVERPPLVAREPIEQVADSIASLAPEAQRVA
jgi:SpoVK/Ycf46/Vps4 family AAA+-type ATPase